jgi:hypothetical protein
LRSFHNYKKKKRQLNFQATLAAMRRWEDECAIQSSAFRVLNYMHLIQEHEEQVTVREAGGIGFILHSHIHQALLTENNGN